MKPAFFFYEPPPETNYKPFPYRQTDSRKFFGGYIVQNEKHPAEKFSPHPDDDREREPQSDEKRLTRGNYHAGNKNRLKGRF